MKRIIKKITDREMVEITRGFYITLAILSLIFYVYGSFQLYEAKTIKRDLEVRIESANMKLDSVEQECREIMNAHD